MKTSTTLVLGFLVALAGCAAEPITDKKVLFSNADTIKVQWDEILSSEAAARAMAVEHCGGRQLELIDASSDAALFGMVKTKTWRCVSAPAQK